MLRKRLTYVVAVVALILVICIVIYFSLYLNQTSVDQTQERKAAIVDHLSISKETENPAFFETSRAILKTDGFHVYYYAGGAVTVDFYRNLPSRGFELIILRVHSTGESVHEYEPGDFVVFFTSEKYSKTKYIDEQIKRQVAATMFPYDEQKYFGITPLFVKDGMNGRFNNTVIIMMGCDGLKYTSMAEAFIRKGAKVYIGWNGLVGVTHTDLATTHLLQNLVTEKQTIKQAVMETVNEIGPDPTYESTLSFYPIEAKNYVMPNSMSELTLNVTEIHARAKNLSLPKRRSERCEGRFLKIKRAFDCLFNKSLI